MTLIDPEVRTAPRPEYQLTQQERRFIGWHLIVAIAALSIGSLFGPLQAFDHSGLDL